MSTVTMLDEDPGSRTLPTLALPPSPALIRALGFWRSLDPVPMPFKDKSSEGQSLRNPRALLQS